MVTGNSLREFAISLRISLSFLHELAGFPLGSRGEQDSDGGNGMGNIYSLYNNHRNRGMAHAVSADRFRGLLNAKLFR